MAIEAWWKKLFREKEVFFSKTKKLHEDNNFTLEARWVGGYSEVECIISSLRSHRASEDLAPLYSSLLPAAQKPRGERSVAHFAARRNWGGENRPFYFPRQNQFKERMLASSWRRMSKDVVLFLRKNCTGISLSFHDLARTADSWSLIKKLKNTVLSSLRKLTSNLNFFFQMNRRWQKKARKKDGKWIAAE